MKKSVRTSIPPKTQAAARHGRGQLRARRPSLTTDGDRRSATQWPRRPTFAAIGRWTPRRQLQVLTESFGELCQRKRDVLANCAVAMLYAERRDRTHGRGLAR